MLTHKHNPFSRWPRNRRETGSGRWHQQMRQNGYSLVWVKFGDGQIEIVTNSKDAPKVIRYRA